MGAPAAGRTGGVVALMVLGPEQLPKLVRQAGVLRADLRRWRDRLDGEVRGAFPDLPPAHEIAAAVRSPLALLDRLAVDAGTASPAAEPEPAVTQVADPWDSWPGPVRRTEDAASLDAVPLN